LDTQSGAKGRAEEKLGDNEPKFTKLRPIATESPQPETYN